MSQNGAGTCADRGSLDFLQKPVIPNVLLRKVREVLDRSRDTE